MNKKLYNLMDWAEIEAIVYGECENPGEILGPHTVGKSTLVQAFFPDAKKVSLYIDGKESQKGKTVKEEVKMEKVDDAGFFAALLTGKDRTDYVYHVEYKEKEKKAKDFKDVYRFRNLIAEKDSEKFALGADMASYKLLGAHKMTIDGVRGCLFTVWAPSAIRVSVVGDFNDWNELIHPMMPVGVTGLYELFIPGVEYGANYKYQILIKGGEKLWRADPYSFLQDVENGSNSVLTNLGGFRWEDEKWQKNKKQKNLKEMPLNIYELHPGTFRAETKNIKELAPEVVSYAKEMGYSHVELMPFMEYVDDHCNGYHVSNFYAPTGRYGTPKDYMAFVNELHKAGIGVIFQWTPNCFSNREGGLGQFDGFALYEHEDYRKGIDPRNGMLLFNYNRPEVEEFLLSNVFFWLDEYHFDGVKVCGVTEMLYLDYYRNPGEWIPNIYGGNENLEAISFLQKLNRRLHRRNDGVFTIADENSGWNGVTLKNNADTGVEFPLGFDFVMHHGFWQDVLSYMEQDPYLRKDHHEELTVSTLYRHKEDYLLSFSHQLVDCGKKGIIDKMPGDILDKMANMRALYGYFMMHPGKKSMFMGQEIGEFDGFDGQRNCQWDLLEYDHHKKLQQYVKDLNLLYKEHEAVHSLDYEDNGFEMVAGDLSSENVVSFMRTGKKEQWMVVLNFANTEYEKLILEVKYPGRYKEIFSSDEEKYGGCNRGNRKAIPSKEEKKYGKENAVKVNLAPLSLHVFEFTPYSKEELEAIAKKKEEQEKLRQEKLRQKKMLEEEKAKIRASLKEELARKIRDAEAAIAAGSETKNKKKR